MYSGEDTLWVSQYLLCVHSLRVSSYIGYIYVHHVGEHLSQKSISYEHLEYTLHKLLISYSDLEKRYDFDLTGVRYSVIIYFFIGISYI